MAADGHVEPGQITAQTRGPAGARARCARGEFSSPHAIKSTRAHAM